MEAVGEFCVVSACFNESSVDFESECCSLLLDNLDGDVSGGWIVDNPVGLPMKDVSNRDKAGGLKP